MDSFSPARAVAGRVVVLATGGTIASRHDAQRDVVVASVPGEVLLAGLGALAPDIAVSVEQACSIGSFAMDLPTSFAVARRADALLAEDDVLGVVVTHGTDTMEESAYLADLVLRSDKPVVFTGAQRNADAPDSDGPRNLADAIRLAAAPVARGLGAMILFEGEFHAARDATKAHASRVGTFTSAEHGKLGEIDGSSIVLHRRPATRLRVPAERIEPDIELIKLAIGASGRLVRCAAEDGARGIVLEAFGRGNATPAVTAAVADAVRAGVVVLVTSRCPQGRVLPIYGDGGGKDLAAAGARFCGDLTGVKARILLAVLLGLPEGAAIDSLLEQAAQ